MAYFNYRNLDPTEFEALAKDIMERLLGRRLFRYGQGKDGGIDLCDDIKEKHIIVQCKKYQQGSFDSLYSVLNREEKPKIDNLNPKPERYYVFTSLELLPQQKQRILELFQEYMEESCIVDGITINNFFRDEQNHDLIPRNIKLFRYFPENYQYSPDDLSQIEENRLYDRLFSIFENDRKNHPSIRMMDPDPLLFPKGLPEILSDGRYAVEEQEDPRAIRDMIQESWKREDHRHILLIGEGGIGKTVAMLTLSEEDWFKKLGIPVIYVPLQRLDPFKGDLNRYIKEKIGSNNFERCIDLANGNLKGHPRLLLLLDGFNEIPDKYKKDAGKYIREWMERPGIQIITTSRLGFFLENSFSKYRLQPLPYSTVRSFLLTAGIKEEQLPGQNDKIWDVINVPLILTLYTQIEKVRETANHSASVLEWKDPNNAAHIIWDYLQIELYRYIEKDDSTYSTIQYATAILAIAPYVCCQMSRQNKFYIKREEFHNCIHEAMSFYTAHQELTSRQILKLRQKYAPYQKEDLFQEDNMEKYARILIDNMALFQEQESVDENRCLIYTYSLAHQNFRDAFASFFICSSLLKETDRREKKRLLDYADYSVKKYIIDHLSDDEMISIWNRHREEEPEDGYITWILMELIGLKRNYDYREIDFSNIDLSITNVHRLLSYRVDICPLPTDEKRFNKTKISINSLLPDGHSSSISSVAFSPDGRTLASITQNTVQLWNLENGNHVALELFSDDIINVAFTSNNKLVACCNSDDSLEVWECNLEDGKCRIIDTISKNFYFAKDRLNIQFSLDGKKMVFFVHSTIYIRYPYENKTRKIKKLFPGAVHLCLSLSSNGENLAYCICDHHIGICNIEKDEHIDLGRDTNYSRIVILSQDGKQLFSASLFNSIVVRNLDTGEIREMYNDSTITNMAVSPDGRQVATTSGGTISLWDTQSGECHELFTIDEHISSISYSPDGRYLAYGMYDGSVKIQDLVRDENRFIIRRSFRYEDSFCFHRGSGEIVGRLYDGRICVYNTVSGETETINNDCREKIFFDLINCLAYSSNGIDLVCGLNDGTVRRWNLKSGKYNILTGLGNIVSIACSKNGKILCGSSDNNVWLCDIFNNKIIHLGMLYGYGVGCYTIICVAFSPDERQVACLSEYHEDDYFCCHDEVDIWDLEDLKHCNVIAHSDSIEIQVGIIRSDDEIDWILKMKQSYQSKGLNKIAYSPEGEQMAIASSDDGLLYIKNIKDNNQTTERRFFIIPHLNLCGANFKLSIIDKHDKELFLMAGARV